MPEVQGNIAGLARQQLDELTALYDYRVARETIIPVELLDLLAHFSGETGREIAIYINRRGQIVNVTVGDRETVSLAEVDGRRAINRFSGIRCIHTHPGGCGQLSPVDLAALAELKLDLMAAVGVHQGRPTDFYLAYLLVKDDRITREPMIVGPFAPDVVPAIPWGRLLRDLEKAASSTLQVTAENLVEKAILVGVERPGKSAYLEELAQLALTAGAEVVGNIVQAKSRPDPAYYIGAGKVRELSLLRQSLEANVVIIDDELSPAQNRNLELQLGSKVIDRTGLILDIFAQRARTREGKLQVELAQLKYLLPRLTGRGVALSRLGGGIGTRGPGETKLEVDRRRLRRRIIELEKDLENVKKHRGLHRGQRQAVSVPVVALVGYTNAGKSSVLNKLTGAEVLAEDKLFATLDPTTRRIELPGRAELLLTDTVGFIRKLPHHLVSAFRATLEEVQEADLLIHVADASHPEVEQQIAAVNKVLDGLGVLNKPVILALNKIDRLDGRAAVEDLLRLADLTVAISALSGEGLEQMLEMVENQLAGPKNLIKLLIPYDQGQILDLLHREGRIATQNYGPDGIIIEAEVNPALRQQLEFYLIS